MRMRKKKHGAERLAACSDYLLDDFVSFSGGGAVGLEIGCGKGGFICRMAAREPERRFVAVEKISDVILLAAERAKAEELKNIRFLNADAAALAEYIAPKSVDTIYLNFNDPWTKKGYTKRRLTYRAFLDIYRSLLIGGGRLILKTDNVPYFDFSLGELAGNGFIIESHTYDLHADEGDNIRTEYETAFSEKGIKICRLIASPAPERP